MDNEYIENEELKNAVLNMDIDKVLEYVPGVPRDLLYSYCEGYINEKDEEEKEKFLICIESMHIRKALDQNNVEQLMVYVPSLDIDSAKEYCSRYQKLHDSEMCYIMDVVYNDVEYSEMCSQIDEIVLDLLNKSKKNGKHR